MIQQVTVFLENKKGSLVEITSILKELKINIISFSLADTEDFGLLRLIVSDPILAHEKLREHKISAHLSEVLAIGISAKVGTLNDLIVKLEDFDIEYLYVYSNREDLSGVILRIDRQEEARDLLERENFKILTKEEVYTDVFQQ